VRSFVVITLIACCNAVAQSNSGRSTDALLPREGQRLLDGVWIRPAGAFEFRQLVAASIVQTRLMLAIAPDASWKPKLINARRIIAEAEPDESLWWMMLTQTTQLVDADRRGVSLVMLPCVDPLSNKTAPLQLAGVTVSPGGVIIRGAGVAESRFVMVEYKSDRDGRAPRLTVVTAGGRGYDFVGDDLVDLLKRDAQVVRRFLGPLLRQLAGRDLLQPRAADVYRALPEIEPTEREIAEFNELLSQLNQADRAAREAAIGDLRQRGAPAVLAALRTDFSKLSPEQSTQLVLLMEENTLGETDVSKLRADIEWLRALENFPNRRVKELACELMAEMVD
jgi:hypothetical protein